MKKFHDKESAPKKYASLFNLDIPKENQMSVDANQYDQSWQQQRSNPESARVEDQINKSDKQTSKVQDNLLLHSLKPCPFNFLTAVKRKLVISGNNSQLHKTSESSQSKQVPEGTMDFIKPLKVPDLKISPKVDYSSRESLLSSEELSKKIEAVQREEMSQKNADKGPRKLEFSTSSSTSMLNYENIESLKIPDLSISKKKDLSRDSSREKENRSKRIKKDDFMSYKNKDDLQDILNWPKGQRHISRKEIADATINKKFKSDRILAHGPKDDPILKKSKTKNVVTSTVKKDEDKRYRHSNIPQAKARKDKSLESRTSSSDSIYPADKGTKLHDKILIREGYKAMISEINDRKHKDDSYIGNSSKTSDDQKYKSHSETRLTKHSSKSSIVKPIDILSSKRSLEKPKINSKADSKHSSEISEDLTTAVSSIASFAKSPSSVTEGLLTAKNKDIEKFSQTSGRTAEEPKYPDIFSSGASPNLVSNSTMIETKFSLDSSISERLLDPSKISFRDDSYSTQPEFVDLVAPDMNLTLRSKKRKQILLKSDDESDYKDSKQNSNSFQEDQDIEKTKTAQPKVEMNLFDSFNESLFTEKSKQFSVDVEKQTDSRDNDIRKIESELENTVDDNKIRSLKSSVKVVEVQTQTANDIATQTDTMHCQRGVNTSLIFSRISNNSNDISLSSINSDDKCEEMDRVEDISLPGKMRTLSEISLHETTSSIKTETGTEISISTRDITCAFNKYLDLEMAQLIKDERQSNDKIEMLFKSREKILNDKTKKLVKLEEQKRALRDTGQDSRISSVKKKQRALLLKLQQEKDEMNRLKELHKIASQERKLMLQKQRDMFNPEMSTKNILNKLKRSADNQSPRRLSGPMKGYDIRSNSSISSLIDSDKSQFDRSQLDLKNNLSDGTPQKNQPVYSRLELNSSLKQDLNDTEIVDKKDLKSEHQKESSVSKLKYDLKTRKFEDKMPKSDVAKLRSHQYDFDSILKHGVAAINLLRNDQRTSLSQDEDVKSISEHVKSESDALIEEFAQIWKSQFPDHDSELLDVLEAPETQEAFKDLQKVSYSKRLDKESLKKSEQHDNKTSKRKSIKNQKSKLPPEESTTKSESSQYIEEAFRHHTKRSKIDSEHQSDDNYQNSMLEELDFNESQSSLQALLKHSNILKERNQKLLQDIVDERNNVVADNSESPLSQKEEDLTRVGNTSARSQLSLTISHQSSNDSDRSYSRSVVIRSQQDHRSQTGFKTSKKLEQILRAREATLVSRRNCVEEWIAWHARLREEENRVARMEQAAYKLVSATAKALSHNDTTISSDTSDVEGRIELLTQKLADRRLEMTRLKKEARKQAKQRLRALEADLLNQIKRYDSAINEMRKKLETKKIKENEKLAIESRSVIDFKVPEIPLKKIQEIYKNSDLLRLKSDSDLISAKTVAEKDGKLKSRSNDSEIDSTRSNSSVNSKLISSLYTVYDQDHESSEKSDYSAVHSNHTKSNSEDFATQKSIITDIQDIRRSSSQSSNISEDIPSESYSLKSPTDSVKTAKASETLASQYMSEKIDGGSYNEISKKDIKENTYIEEELSPVADDVSIIFSKKLDHIQLNNKELSDDIHNLENDFKKLTEMMSNISKKSEEQNAKSFDLTEETSEVVKNSIFKDITEESIISTEVTNSLNVEKDLQARVQKILSDVVPETDDLITSIEELDNKFKFTEPDKLEKSIPSEVLNKISETEEIITDMTSTKRDKILNSHNHESDVNYISEIVSTVVEDDLESVPLNESETIIQTTSQCSEENISVQNNSECGKFPSIHTQRSNLVESLKQNETTLTNSIDLNLNKMNDKINALMDMESAHDKLTVETKNQEEIFENKLSTLSDDRDVFIKEVENKSFKENSLNKTVESDNNWTLSDSFEIQRIEEKESENIDMQLEQSTHVEKSVSKTGNFVEQKDDQNGLSDMEDSTMFIPKGESTNLPDEFILKLDDSSDHRIGIRSDEFNDILEIIERETKIDDESHPSPAILQLEDRHLPKVDLKINSPVECDVSITVNTVDEESESIEEEIEDKTGSASESLVYNKDLPHIEIGLKFELINSEKSIDEKVEIDTIHVHDEIRITEIKEISGDDRGSSDGEQMDNLVEVVEGKLDTKEKLTSTKEKTDTETSTENPKTHVQIFFDKTFEVIKDPGYEDISEESLEVSEIIDKTDSTKSKKFSTVPEKYVIKSKPDEVLSILDEISKKSNTKNYKDKNCDGIQDDKILDPNTACQEISEEKRESIPPSSSEKLSDFVNLASSKEAEPISIEEIPVLNLSLEDSKSAVVNVLKKPEESPRATSSDSSEALDTPGGISEIDMDSPRDIYDNSRLDVDALDDDLLSSNLLQSPINEAKTEFRTTPMGITSEKEIEAAINNLKATLEQPGLEVAEVEGKLLQIENLQIELEIKKLERLESEEVSFYVREIPNKPPPPYTPPGAIRLSSSKGSPSPPPVVIPTNVEELTAVTEKATAIIYNAKQTGQDILEMVAPSEICELAKDKNDDSLKVDRRIYNTFLFDLCKELVVEMYKTDNEKPGPSWTKPNVKTKSAIKIAESLDELNEYVSKEVATLFGFKTKLQRENMVMRWSRKRRDRVDELLAKEAQAEEKEWTKFHHDELAVKNELTVTILDTLIQETTSCIKAAYAKKHKTAVI